MSRKERKDMTNEHPITDTRFTVAKIILGCWLAFLLVLAILRRFGW